MPPRANLITSLDDHPKKTKRVSVHSSRTKVSTQSLKQESIVSHQQPLLSKLVTGKDQTLQSYPDVFEGIGCFPGPPYHIQLDPIIHPGRLLIDQP